MRCGTRSLGLLSLGFGLVATGALSLAVATDYWLYTVEPLEPNNVTFDSSAELASKGQGHLSVAPNVDLELLANNQSAEFQEDHETGLDIGDSVPGPPEEVLNEATEATAISDAKQEQQVTTSVDLSSPAGVVVSGHSGLWRLCIVNDEPDESVPPHACQGISYFGQQWDRIDGAETTMSIMRAIRKAAPAILGSLLLLLTALSLSIVGTTKNDFKIIVSAIIYIFSALSLGMGVILYISSVNDEVAHRKKQPDTSTDHRHTFTYQYGWAFFFDGATFVCAMGAAVSNISLYLRRYSHFDDKLFIVQASTNISTTTSTADNGQLIDNTNSASSTGYQPVRQAAEYPTAGRHVYECKAPVTSSRWPPYESRKSFDSCRSVHAATDYGITIPL